MGTLIRQGVILRDGTTLTCFEVPRRAGDRRGPARVVSLFPATALEKHLERLAKRTGTVWQVEVETIRRPSKWWRADLVDSTGARQWVFFRSARGRWQRA